MDVILHQVGDLLIKAIPTFLIVVFLYFYLKSVFFKPIDKVLQTRYEATEGARKAAAASLEHAAAKTAEYENRIREARTAIYRSNEQFHRQLAEKHAAEIGEARRRAEAALNTAKQQIAAEVEAAKASLPAESERLAEQIAGSMLARSVA